MKHSHLGAVLATGFVVLVLGRPAMAQQAPPRVVSRPAGMSGAIALLDVSYIFEKHARFKMMMNDMKSDVERAEAEVQAERETIRKLIERLEQFRGTQDYKAMEEEVAKRQGDLAVRIQLQKKEFLQREARIYHTVYQEILQEVEYFCSTNGIEMVLRFNGDAVDVERPDSVLAFINRPVVWYSKDRDITGYILKALNDRALQATGPAPGGTRPAPTPPPFR